MTMVRSMRWPAAVLLVMLAVIPSRAQTYYQYACSDGANFVVAFFPQTKGAFLQIDGKSLRLPKRFSLTSQRFSKGGVTLSIKGSVATVKHLGKTSHCQVK